MSNESTIFRLFLMSKYNELTLFVASCLLLAEFEFCSFPINLSSCFRLSSREESELTVDNIITGDWVRETEDDEQSLVLSTVCFDFERSLSSLFDTAESPLNRFEFVLLLVSFRTSIRGRLYTWAASSFSRLFYEIEIVIYQIKLLFSIYFLLLFLWNKFFSYLVI